ncbi:MAG: TspO/MBR family protein [bacterium]|nr:TspO/MBR family protein [bacterium]
MLRSEQRFRLMLCVGAPVLLGILTGIFNLTDIIRVCKKIHRPPLTAPALLMVLIWLAIYIAIGLATYVVLDSRVYKEEKLLALGSCAGQLLLHTFWIMLFFNTDIWLLSAFVHLLYLALVLLNTLLYYKIDNRSGLLLAPCALVSIYYTYLSLVIIFIN